MTPNGRHILRVGMERWWVQKGPNLRPMDYGATVVPSQTLFTSVNLAVKFISVLRLLYPSCNEVTWS